MRNLLSSLSQHPQRIVQHRGSTAGYTYNSFMYQSIYQPTRFYHGYASATDRKGPSGFPADVSSALGTLGILDSSSANSENVKKKYKQLVAKFHPDVPGGSDTKMKTVNTAYDVIRKYEEQNGGSLKPCARMYESNEQYGFCDADDTTFQDQVRRHARGMHIRHDDEDAFETFHDFVFGGGLKQNFHTVEFKQRSARRKKPNVYDEYKYFTSFDDGEADDQFFQESDDYMNNFDDWGEPPQRENHRHHGKQGGDRQNSQNFRRPSRRPTHQETFYDEYHNDENYQQRDKYMDSDEVFYSQNRFYGTQQPQQQQQQRQHRGSHPNTAKNRRDGQRDRHNGDRMGRQNGDRMSRYNGDRMGRGHHPHRRRSSYNIDDSPIDFM